MPRGGPAATSRNAPGSPWYPTCGSSFCSTAVSRSEISRSTGRPPQHSTVTELARRSMALFFADPPGPGVKLVSMPRDPTDDAPLSRQLWPADLASEPFAAVFLKHFAALRAAHQAQPYH